MCHSAKQLCLISNLSLSFFHASGEIRAGNALNGVNARNAGILKKNIEKDRKANVVSWVSSSPSIKPFTLTESAVH